MRTTQVSKLVWCATFVFCAVASIFPAPARAEEGLSADAALKELVEGNSRYVEGRSDLLQRSHYMRRAALAQGQKPYAIVLGCSDSRVPPEIIFDKGLGEIFVVRVAGNVPDPVVIGSIEYAAEHLGVPLLVILGHERCGAVTASVDSKEKAPGNIGSIVQVIAPAVAEAKKTCESKEKPALVECAVKANIKHGEAVLTMRSTLLKKLVKEGKLRIVGATYDLDDGKVTFLDK